MHFIDIHLFICYINITYLENFWTIRLTDSLYAKYDGSSADNSLSRAPFVIIMKGVCMNQKKLKDLNLMDDFLFQAVMTYPDIGELFAQKILELIFHQQFQNLTIVAQKVYGGMDTDLRGARLDLYVEENDHAKMDAAYNDSI